MSDAKSGFTRRDLVRGTLVGAIAAGVSTKTRARGRSAGTRARRRSSSRSTAPCTALRRAPRHAGRRAARAHRPDGHQGRLRPRRLRRLHGPARRRDRLLLSHARARGLRQVHHDDRGAGRRRPADSRCRRPSSRPTPSSAASARREWSCRASVLLDHNPRPSPPERSGRRSPGNLCRCGTYNHVFDAVERVAGLKTAEGPGAEGLPSVLFATPGEPRDRTGSSTTPASRAATREALEEEALR